MLGSVDWDETALIAVPVVNCVVVGVDDVVDVRVVLVGVIVPPPVVVVEEVGRDEEEA